MKPFNPFKLVHFITLFALFGVNLAMASSIDVKIQGINEPHLVENMRLYVEMVDKEDAEDVEYYQEQVQQAIDKALRAYGYYQNQITFQFQPAPSSQKAQLIANVQLGKAVKIAETNVEIIGEAKQDKDFMSVVAQVPKAGTQLNHEQYDDYKNNLTKQALLRGYFDADFLRSRLEVMPSTQQAWWNLAFNSGVRYRYGEFRFEHSQIREDFLRNMMNVQSGDFYFINDLSTLTNNYTATNWFSSVLLQPRIDENAKVVNIDLLLYPRKKNSMEVGIGWASDVGPRLQLSWTKPWINSRGHSLRTSLYVSAPKQNLTATYKMPLLRNPLDYYYEISAGFENEKHNDIKNLTATLAALRYWNHKAGWQYSVGLRTRYDAFSQGNVNERTLLIYPTATVSRTRLQGGLFPSWGDAQRLTVDLGRTWWLSDVNFFKIQGSSTWIRTYATNHRFVSRVEAGWLHTKDLERIPPSLRFSAGGDRSVRGYGYKKISPKNAKNKLVGASRLLTGSVEYQYQVYSDWWLATFADAGFAANRFSVKEMRYGAGFGVRWASPVGAVKLDIATPIRDKDNSKNIQFYLGLGAEL